MKDLSRFGRVYIERLFPAMGVRFIAVNDNYDSLDGKEMGDEIIIPFKSKDLYGDAISLIHFDAPKVSTLSGNWQRVCCNFPQHKLLIDGAE